MENDSVRTSGTSTLVDMWIDGKLRAITVSREAIESFLHLTPDRAASMSEDERSEFVRTHLTLVVSSATAKLRNTDATADAVTLDGGERGGGPPAAPRPEHVRPPAGARLGTPVQRMANAAPATGARAIGARSISARRRPASAGGARERRGAA